MLDRLRLRREDGQSLVLIILVLPVMLAIVALVVDGSRLFLAHRSVQTAADAAALAAAQEINSTATHHDCNGVQVCAQLYSSRNGGPSSLHACTSSSDSQCYKTPYNGDSSKVEVRLTNDVGGYFTNALGLSSLFKVSARAVATVTNGPPPQITFAALNSSTSCDHHTLVIRSSGNLVVNNKIYVDTCNGLGAGTKGDGFDVFGPGGSISAKDILVHGGWETHDGDPVIIPVNGTTCPLLSANSTTPWQAGCPKVGQPALSDPFPALPPPSLGSPVATSCTVANPCYNTGSYTPSQILDDGDGSIDATQTSILVHGRSIANGTYVSIDGERMKVTATANSTSLPNPPNGRTITVLRGQLGTTAGAHTAPSAISITHKSCAEDKVTLTTAVPHGLTFDDWVKVIGVGTGFDGIYQVTDIPDDESGNPKELSYTGSCGNVGAWDVVRMSRTGGVSTLTTSTAHGLQPGDLISVDLTGSDTSFDVEEEDGVTVQSVPSPTTFTYLQFGLPDVRGTPVDIKTVQRFEGTATIVTQQNHTLLLNHFATIDNPDDTSFNGHVQVTNVNSNTKFEYSGPAADVKPDVLANGLSKVQRVSGISTLTTGGIGTLAVGDYVVVNVTTAAYTSFNGKFRVTAINAAAKTFSYSQTGLPDVNPAAGAAGSWDNLLPVATFSRTGGVARIVTTVAHGFANGNDVLVDLTSDGSFSGTFSVTKVDNFTFTYPNPGANVSATAGGSGDGVLKIHGAGGALDETGDGGKVIPDDAVTTGTVSGPALPSSGGSVIGPLFEIFNVDPTPVVGSSPTAPVEYAVPAGTSQVLNPGTYYGGICIGRPVGTHCGPKVGGTCATSTAAPATVIMNPGIYIMAGGGFYVCGNTTLDASAGVMIYNTVDSDPAASTFSASKLDQVELNTNGTVTLSPLATASLYRGMTIYQGPDPAGTASPNPNLQLSTAQCDGRSLSLTDIALSHAGNGLNGISGTIYAPGQYALVRDTVSGTATLAVISGCIFIDGADSTFNFDAGGDPGDPLFGIEFTLSE